MSAVDASSPLSLTEDYVGLARYLAQAIARGEVPIDHASIALAGADDAERASLQRAAGAARSGTDGDIAAELLARAQTSGS